MGLLIKNVLLNQNITDILVDGNRIKTIAPDQKADHIEVIDGSDFAAIPGFINAHTHSAMTLFRGYGDDLPLEEWLETMIWPNETRLTDELVYWGSKLACLEMIKGGTTFFADMYWHQPATVRAVTEMGLRANLSSVLFDAAGPEQGDALKKQVLLRIEEMKSYPDTITLSLAPHAIYTASEELLRWAKKEADKHGLLLQIHLSETENEVNNCIKKEGCRPVEYLERIGFLDHNVVVSHAVWLSDNDISILAKRDVKVVHNPASNLKLSSGFKFRYPDLKAAGITVGLGTDGTSSNNCLSMFDSLKWASLIQKAVWNDPTALPVDDTFDLATTAGGTIFNLNMGTIEEGALADFSLIDLNDPALVPAHNLKSNLVYSASDRCVNTVICDGKVIMRDRQVPNEAEIIKKTRELAHKFLSTSPTPHSTL